ncbi:unnamed protein product [Rotaria magnacalcarata]|uniref:CBF1-interacting co-repressor CIR N-terminal domain-containing protein n=4 Tax=Rotaria magnacalcarata TaxID=392030 RepID=A0A8S2L7V0_9BILA|nr:unnamed protein product [Rotaria magnacalcarata]
MNILPKKRWHVRTKDNIARVLRDEKKAAEEEQKTLRRKTLAEQEARLNNLRAKRGDHLIQFQSSEEATAKEKPLEHVNLFQLEEKGLKTTNATNDEHEKEKKAETEEFEKKLGLLTYLGGSVVESKGTVPWYMERGANKPAPSKELSKTDREERDRLRIEKQDPLNSMSKYVEDLKRKRDDENKSSSTKTKKSTSSATTLSSSSASRIEQLRAQRLKRESEERAKTASYLSRVFTGTDPIAATPEPTPPVETDDRKRRYHSQFNPDFAKQNTQQYATTHDMNWRGN